MIRLPYGYRMVRGKIEVDDDQAARLRVFFLRYLNGTSIEQARLAAGIDLHSKTCRSMLLNHAYLGTTRLPPILEPEVLDAAEREIARRGQHLRGKTGWTPPEIPIESKFIFAPLGAPPEEANAYVSWAYAGICLAGQQIHAKAHAKPTQGGAKK